MHTHAQRTRARREWNCSCRTKGTGKAKAGAGLWGEGAGGQGSLPSSQTRAEPWDRHWGGQGQSETQHGQGWAGGGGRRLRKWA